MNFLSWHDFPNSEALAEKLADHVARALTARLEADGAAALAVAGGTTPIRFFEILSALDLDWSKVTITLVDDRWVPDTSPRSNARLVRTHLLQRNAAAADFLPLVSPDDAPEDAVDAVEAAIAALPLPFAAVILGMGKDGHFASIFPEGDRLSQALAGYRHVEIMHADAAVEPRVTLTLPIILAADVVAIHIEGERKRAVLDLSLEPGPIEHLPIRAVLARTPTPDIFWCP
jgi:6-phosphogluconolactonase